MLIDYSIRSYEILERKLTAHEKEEVYTVFKRMGARMQLKDLPRTYIEWLPVRKLHLKADMIYSNYTADLYKQYKKHLGWLRFFLLKQAQILVVPKQASKLLRLGNIRLLSPVILIYKFFRLLKLQWFLKNLILPAAYKVQIKALDVNVA